MTQRRQMKPQTCDSISPAAEQKQIRLKTKGKLGDWRPYSSSTGRTQQVLTCSFVQKYSTTSIFFATVSQS